MNQSACRRRLPDRQSVWLSLKSAVCDVVHGGAIDGVPGDKVIRAINHHITLTNQRVKQGVIRAGSYCVDLHVRVDIGQWPV